MEVIVLFFGAVAVGFLLIVLIAATSPAAPAIDLRAESGNSPLVELNAEDLGKLVAEIISRMGLEVERANGGGDQVLEIRAVNPTPITGGTVLIHCLPAPRDTGRVDGVMVGRFLRAVRSAYVNKGLLFTTGMFTPDARLAAEEAPIELFDREEIMKLVEKLPKSSP